MKITFNDDTEMEVDHAAFQEMLTFARVGYLYFEHFEGQNRNVVEQTAVGLITDLVIRTL